MQERLQRLKVFLFDVDGVLTDGRIIFDNNGVETKAFDVKDGHGLKLLQRAGLRLGLITGRQSEVTLARARELGIDIVFQGVRDKLTPYLELLQTLGVTDEEVGYMGDDLVDLPIMRRAGFAATVADAVEEVKPYAHYVTPPPGWPWCGAGGLRSGSQGEREVAAGDGPLLWERARVSYSNLMPRKDFILYTPAADAILVALMASEVNSPKFLRNFHSPPVCGAAGAGASELSPPPPRRR